DRVRYDFSHDRLRDCAYLEVSPVQHRLLHRRVAQALQKVHAKNLAPVTGEIAMHYERAGLLEEAFDYYRQAGELAKQFYAHREAATYLTKALVVLQSLPQGSERTRREIDLQLELGLAQILVSGWGSEPVGRAYQQAYGLALQAGTTFQMCRVLLSL